MNVLLALLHYTLHNEFITSYLTMISIFPPSVITFKVLYIL